MKDVIKFLQENWKAISGAGIALWELFVRIKPTARNWSIIDLIKKIADIIPNLKKGGGQHFIILFILSLCLTANKSDAQSYNWNKGMFMSTVGTQDTVAVKALRDSYQTAYGNSSGLYFDKVRNKWKVWNGSAWVDWTLFSGGSGTLSGTLTAPRIPYASGTSTLVDNAALTFTSGTGTVNATNFNASSNVTAGALTSGRVVFTKSGGLMGVDNGLRWDSVNNILSIGTAGTPPGVRIFQQNDGLYMGRATGNTAAVTTFNTIVGCCSGESITGDGNTGFGYAVFDVISTGARNTAVGVAALGSCNSCTDNVVVGYDATNLPLSGVGNIGLGRGTLRNLSTESFNVALGHISQVPAGANGGLSIQNIIYGTGNTNTGLTPSTGNIGIGIQAPSARFHLPAGSATASTAPLKFNSGTLLGTAEAGAMEFLTDKYYGTITTGAARKEFTLNDQALTSGRVPIVTTNGRLTDDSDFTWDSSNEIFNISTTDATGDFIIGNIGSTNYLTLATSGSQHVLSSVNPTKDLAINAAQGQAGNANGKNLSLSAGAGVATNGNGGGITLTAGARNGSGTGGSITLVVSSSTGGYIVMTGLPTSCAGVPTGGLANVAGVLNICP